MLRSFSTTRSPSTETATVTVVYKNPFTKGIEIVENQMVDNSVTEITGKNFSFDRRERNKTNASGNLIFPTNNFLVKSKKFLFIIKFKPYGACSFSLVLPRIEVSLEKIEEELGRHR